MINKNHITFLSKKDKILKKIIEQNEKPQISKSKDYVLDLCKYIIFQQISTKALGGWLSKLFNVLSKYFT